MREYLAASWWMLLLQGLLLLLLGIFALVVPGLTLYSFAFGFAIYLILTGFVNALLSLGAVGRASTWFLWAIVAALELGVGVYALKHLGLTAGTLILLVGIVFVVRGVQQLVSAFADGNDARNRTVAAIVGALSLVAGVWVWLYPASGALAFTWVVGLYGLLAGSMALSLALEARPALSLR